METRGWLLALVVGLLLSPWSPALAGDDSKNEEALAGVSKKDEASDDDVSKKSFKKDAKEEGQERPGMGGTGYVRKIKVDLKADAMDAAATSTTLAAGAMVTVNEDRGEWIKVTGEAGAMGWAKKDDFRTRAPRVWKSNRDSLVYQDCLGKECEGKKAKDVDKKTKLLEVDRGGPKNAFIFVKMPNDQFGWVPIAYMMEWEDKFD